MIERILNRWGYYKCDLPEGTSPNEAEILEMFKTYGESKSFLILLRDLLARDKDFYFNAQTDKERENIHGASARTNYFISLIKKANDKRKPGSRD